MGKINIEFLMSWKNPSWFDIELLWLSYSFFDGNPCIITQHERDERSDSSYFARLFFQILPAEFSSIYKPLDG